MHEVLDHTSDPSKRDVSWQMCRGIDHILQCLSGRHGAVRVTDEQLAAACLSAACLSAAGQAIGMEPEMFAQLAQFTGIDIGSPLESLSLEQNRDVIQSLNQLPNAQKTAHRASGENSTTHISKAGFLVRGRRRLRH